MNFPPVQLLRALSGVRSGSEPAPVCLVCHEAVRKQEAQLRLRGETYVHSRCATYRMRTRPGSYSRLGYPW